MSEEDITVLKLCPSTCEKRDSCGSESELESESIFSKPESESESESLKFGRLRSPGKETCV